MLHLMMISVGAYFIADMANLFVGSYLEGSYGVSNRPQQPPIIPKANEPRALKQRYDMILERNIFNSQPRISAANTQDPTASEAEAPAALAPLNVTLVGTVVMKGTDPYAVFRESNKQDQTIVRRGETIGETAEIIEIDRNKIVVLRGGKKEILQLTLEAEKVGRGARPVARRATPPNPRARPGGTIRQVSGDQWLLDRREIDDAMKNLPALLTKARIIPNFKNGQPDGFRIFAIAKDSLYSKIGLQNGDILNRINGVEVKDPQNFMKVLEQIKDENDIRIDLVRNNKNQTFRYDIR